MEKPEYLEYRAAILGAFDRHTLRTVKDINEHLKKVEQFYSYRSTLRTLDKMVDEGLISRLPKRGDKNSIIYSKLVFNHSTVKLVDYNGELVTLKDFIASVMDTEFPPIVDANAASVIKQWMLDSLASSYPEPYEGKRDVPDAKAIKRKLNGTLEMTRKLHTFLKAFLESDVFSPVARETLAEEFRETASMEHVIIVERSWDQGPDSD